MNGIRAYRSLTLANLRMLIRNPVGSSSLFLVLVLLVVVMKVVTSGPPPQTKVELVNQSATPLAGQAVAAIRSVPSFDVTTASEGDAGIALSSGKSDMSVVIPPSFGQTNASGAELPAQLQVRYRAGTAGESSLPIVKGIAESLNAQALGQSPVITVAASSLNARSYGFIDYFLPGVIAFNIIGSALMVAAGVFATYKSSGVLRRLKATGIKPGIFVLSHATSSFLFGMAQTLLIVAVAVALFSFHLNLPALLLLMALGYLVFLAIGFVISGWIRDAPRATGVTQSIAMPMIFVGLLSASLPAGVAAVTKYLPVSYVTDGVRQLGEGGGIGAIAPDLGWLALWAALLLLAAGRVFRWD